MEHNMLVRLIYVSRARDDVDLAECRRLVSASQASNARADITGVLLFNSMKFVQALEGETDKVNALYNKIARDPRHDSIKLLTYGTVSARLFAQWSMSLVYPNEQRMQSLLIARGLSAPFEPSAHTNQAIDDLLLALAGDHPSLGSVLEVDPSH
jgi:Sensors of blue-light using FAD